MLARQIEAELTLHCADQLSLRLFAEDLFDKGEIGEVVLNVEDRTFFGPQAGLRRRCGHSPRRFESQRRFGAWKLHPKGASLPECTLCSNGAAHRVQETLRQGETKPGAFDTRLLRAQTLEWREESRQ